MTTHDDHNSGIQNPYQDEARERWGHTDAWKQSQERVGKMSKEQFVAVGKEADDITKQIVALKDAGKVPSDPAVLTLVARHYNWLRHFYEPSHEMYRGLGDMYVQDERFAANYDKYGVGTAQFMRDAMHAYCDAEAK